MLVERKKRFHTLSKNRITPNPKLVSFRSFYTLKKEDIVLRIGCRHRKEFKDQIIKEVMVHFMVII